MRARYQVARRARADADIRDISYEVDQHHGGHVAPEERDADPRDLACDDYGAEDLGEEKQSSRNVCQSGAQMRPAGFFTMKHF